MKKAFYLILSLYVSGCAETTSVEFQKVERNASILLLENFEIHDDLELETSFSLDEPLREVSDAGIAMLKKFEGEIRCKDDANLHCAYDDAADFCTIGHGHLIAKSACKDLSVRLTKLGFDNGISDERATEILKNDLIRAQLIVETNLDSDGLLGNVGIDDNQYDSLVSFVFNVGGANFNRSSLLRSLKQRQRVSGNEDIEFQFSRWVRAGGQVYRGLVSRRADEARHFFFNYGLPSETEEESGLLLEDDQYIDIEIGE